jgi:cell fate (sporulation/competence/biofilm development) regulator YlbF (YheA/YmcA/DUF963 family)
MIGEGLIAMSDVFSMAETIAEELKQSGRYKAYLSAKQKIHNDPALKEAVDTYKKANFDYQYRMLHNDQPSFEEEKAVSSLFWKLMNNANAKSYLECEKGMIETMNEIYTIIGGACEIDLYMPES